MVPAAPEGRAMARLFALVASGGTLVLVAILVGLFDRQDGQLQYIDHVSWVEQVGLSWDVGVDGISLWLLALTAGLFFLGIIAAAWRLPGDRPRAYLAMLLLRRGRPARRLRGRRPGALLHLLGGHAHPVLLPDRDVGRRGTGAGHDQVRHLHDGRQPADARVDPGHGLHGAGHHRAVHLHDPRPGRRVVLRHPEHLALPRLRAGLRDQAAPVALPRAGCPAPTARRRSW